VDRGVAGVNAGLIVADMVLAEIPVVGEVALAVTGMYRRRLPVPPLDAVP
jgi:hypothetical protein